MIGAAENDVGKAHILDLAPRNMAMQIGEASLLSPAERAKIA